MTSKQLVNLFTKLENTQRCVRFGDLMRKGFASSMILSAIESTNAELSHDHEGYSIIVF